MMKDLLNKYRIPCVIIMFLLGIGCILSFFYLVIYDTDHDFNNDYYSVSYDGSWHIIKTNEEKLVLSHGKGKLTFNIQELSDNKVYQDIDSLIDDIIYDIEKNNSNYKLLSKEKIYLTKNHFLGYSYLYENKGNNVKVSIYKDSKYIVIITYEADSKYFDMLLDSANNVIYNFKLQEKKYDLEEKLEITNGKINFSQSSEYKSLDDNYTEEIANNNYLVNYTIPKAYQSSRYYSLSGSYSYKGFSDYLKSSNLSVNIYKRNIYEYIKDDTNDSLYQKYNKYRENDKYKENIEKVDKNKDNYIYKNSYIIPSNLGDNFYENVELIYSLDRNHILVVVFENKNVSVSRELIDSFKINFYQNISSYINREESDNKLVSHLKLKGITSTNEIDVKIVLPISYKEVGHNSNVYEKRVFASDYDDINEIYKYNVEYQIYSNEKYAINDMNTLINTNKNNGKYTNLTLEGNSKYNDKEFKVYKANFTSKGGLFYEKTYTSNTKLLIYKLSSDKVLGIKIRVNNDNINNELINELTNFIVENK